MVDLGPTHKTCKLNHCGRPQGIGTHASVEIDAGRSVTIEVCEDHWQMLREILPLPAPRR